MLDKRVLWPYTPKTGQTTNVKKGTRGAPVYMGHTDDKAVKNGGSLKQDGPLTGVLLAHIEKYYQRKGVSDEVNESKEGEKSGSEDGKGE